MSQYQNPTTTHMGYMKFQVKFINMKITINIDERTGNAIREFCKANNLKQNQYLVDIIEKQFNIDRFGDLNELLAKKEKPKQVQMTEVKTDEPNLPLNDDIIMEIPKEKETSPKPRKRTLQTK